MTVELARHHQLVDHIVQVGHKPVAVVKRVITQWPLDRYKVRGEITHVQWRAGDRLRAIFERTGVEPRVIGRYESDVVQNSAKAWDVITDAQDAAHTQLRGCILAVGLELSSVLMHVCCVGGNASDWAANRFQYRGRQAITAGMVSLRMALDGLSRFFDQQRRAEHE